ncbi:unnamed protein product [Kuraishia capsulata CBS 1993]|uniref:Guanine nucleotide-binding protein alpha-1 subunit n=1 Tax=Kuraishia capsulata CBS 1993 TaxID=1382522 RepID=W6MM09_9ASCO|nr:uncharacterized protein KUCA_T00003509001 [Kuraishia capsulata CBS 1993]CDK27531.1 unnamed protein product [Kuraishia capsulata CBS 1993]
MGCTASTPVDDGDDSQYQSKQVNDAIEQMLLLGQQREKNQVKLLLLGTGESGKSTVLKQMRLIHQGGFSGQERKQYSHVIWADMIASMQKLIVQARKLGIPMDCDRANSPLAQHRANVLKYRPLEHIDADVAGGSNFLKNYVLKYSETKEVNRRKMSTGQADVGWGDQEEEGANGPEEPAEIDDIMTGLLEAQGGSSTRQTSRESIAESIDRLWRFDSGIRQCYNRGNEFQLESCAEYYFEKAIQFGDPSYVCTDEDILKGRIKTTGITETNFNIDSFKFKILDAGGQRSERRKWIHCFEDITAVLFVLAVSEYDQMLFEDEKVNRMHEAIMLFESLCNSRWFINTPFILLLNKMDIFEKKIGRSPIRNYFPYYEGKSNDVGEASKYFEKLFLSLNKTKKPIYIHRTCATDTKSMKFVLSAVTDMIVQQNLKKSGIL